MSGLMTIGKSGAIAARAALDITGQNIANASNENYSRRSVEMLEVASTGALGLNSSASLGGVRAGRVLRSSSLFLQNEVRRTTSDESRANAELTGITNANRAIEQAGIYTSLIEFEASLTHLSSDPLDGALRAAVVENGNTLVQTFQIASDGLDVARQEMYFKAADDVEQANLLTGELARTNVNLARALDGSTNKVALLDQRDSLLRQLSEITGINVEYDSLGRVNVRLGDSTGPQLVQGTSSTDMAVSVNGSNQLDITVGGSAVAPDTGKLAGYELALEQINAFETSLDEVALGIINTMNDAQAAGIAPDGSTGTAFFSGTGAADISVEITTGSLIATAPAGASVNSLDTSNLDALRTALASADAPIGMMDTLLYDISAKVSGREVTRDALATIAESAEIALSSETGVDLDNEAANLIRYQQAFQASGRVIEVANTLFDTMLGIR